MLTNSKKTVESEDEARKVAFGADKAWAIIEKAETVVIGKGKKFLTFSPEPSAKEEILKSALGRSGNLRAPTLKLGSTLVIGFNEDMYDAYIK